MSQFSKEELHIIWLSVSRSYHKDLKDKVKAMIDKHCDHEPDETYYEQFRWHSCKKCGVHYK